MPGDGGSGLLRPRMRRLLLTVGNGVTTDEVVVRLRMPVHRVRAALGEAERAGLVEAESGVHRLTQAGVQALRTCGAVSSRFRARD